MNIKELMNSSANVSVMVSLPDLREFVSEMVAEAAASKQEKEETYLTKSEVANLLGVSENTLWRWDRDGYLHSVKVGRTPMYKQSDINKLREGKGE